MALEDPAAEVRRLAKVESNRREKLAAEAAKQLGGLRALAVKLDEQQVSYTNAYKDALEAWGAEQMTAFGLPTPEQAAVPAAEKPAVRRRPAGREAA